MGMVAICAPIPLSCILCHVNVGRHILCGDLWKTCQACLVVEGAVLSSKDYRGHFVPECGKGWGGYL